MRDRLFCLRHHTVISGNDNDRNVRCHGTTGTHLGKGGVTRCIDEGDLLTIFFDLVGTNMLGDPAGLFGGNFGGAYPVEQRGFTVIDVPHDRNDRRTHFGILISHLIVACDIIQRIKGVDCLHFHIKLIGKDFDGILVEKVVFGDHGTESKKHFDHFTDAFADFFGEFIDANVFRDFDHTDLFFCLLTDVPFSLAAASDRSALLWLKTAGTGRHIALLLLPFLRFGTATLFLAFHLFVNVFVGKIQQDHLFLFIKLHTRPQAAFAHDLKLLTGCFGFNGTFGLFLLETRSRSIAE